MDLYAPVLFGYGALYAVLFLVPLALAGRVAGGAEERKRLLARLQKEVAQAQRAAAEVPLPEPVLVGPEGAAGDEPEDGGASGDGAARAGDLAAEGVVAAQRRQRARRTERPEALTTTYTNVLVNETAAYFRARYPTGDFRTFEMERLPVYAQYAERLLAARNMAGLFVLLGLALTMWKLNVVVADIGGLSSGAEMTSDAFLSQMGALMGNTGNAFESSIFGLALMIAALLLIAVVDRGIQHGLTRHDHEVQQALVPALVDLHEAQNPNLSVSDLIAETGVLLGGLNRTVGGLSGRIDASLGGLSDRIEHMMREFGSFTQEYTKLNDLFVELKGATEGMQGVTRAVNASALSLERAGARLSQPIDDLNKGLTRTIDGLAGDFEESLGGLTRELRQTIDGLNTGLNRTLRESVSTAVDALHDARLAQDSVAKELHAMQAGVLKTSEGLQTGLDRYLDRSAEHHEQQRERVEQQLALVDGQMESIEAHGERVDRALKAMIDAMKASNPEEMRVVIQKLSGEVQTSATALRKSAHELQGAARAFRTGGDETLFGWTRQQVYGLRDRFSNR